MIFTDASEFVGDEERDVGCSMPEVRIARVLVVARTFTEGGELNYQLTELVRE
jgi:hypothetical protein